MPPEWLIRKISNANIEEIVMIAKVLWGIGFFRNKKYGQNKVVSHDLDC